MFPTGSVSSRRPRRAKPRPSTTWNQPSSEHHPYTKCAGRVARHGPPTPLAAASVRRALTRLAVFRAGTGRRIRARGLAPPACAAALADERALTETVVVGAGLAGCTTARYLAEQGDEVTLIERHGIGAGASGRNGGWLLRRPDPWVNGLRDQAVSIYEELESAGLECGLHELPLLLVALDAGEMEHARAYSKAVSAQAVSAVRGSLARR